MYNIMRNVCESRVRALIFQRKPPGDATVLVVRASIL